MGQRYYFQRKSGIKQASNAEIKLYLNDLFDYLPKLLPKYLTDDCKKEEFVSLCMMSHLDIYLLALENQFRQLQKSSLINIPMKSRYMDSARLDIVEVKKEQLAQLETAVRQLLKNKQQQQQKLASQQNEPSKLALATVQLEARNKMTEYIKRMNEILDSLQINHIQEKLKQCYQANINQIQQQMDLQISGLLNQLKTLDAAKEKISRQLEAQTKQLAKREIQVSDLAKKCTKFQQEREMQTLRAKKQNMEFLITFWNKKIVPISKYSEVINVDQITLQIQNYREIKIQSSSTFQISQILQENDPVKDFIIGCIETHFKLSISSTRMIFRYDKYHRDFGEYLKESNSPFCIVLKLQNGRICGGFCPGLNLSGQSILFSYLEEGIVINMAAKNQGSIGCSFTSNQLVFGFNELIIGNNQKTMEIRINFSSFGTKYFEKLSRFAEINENNTCKFVELEIHTISFNG